MKQKIYSLLLILLLLCTISCFSTIVSADNLPSEDVTTATEQTLSGKSTIKVNKTIKVKKILKIKKSTLKNMTFSSSNTKIATVSSKGVITGIKQGKAIITVTSNDTGKTYASIELKVKNRYNKKDLRLMSAIIYSEAGAESYAGKKAVGIVIMNRVNSSLYPNDIKSVIYQPYQFSPARNGSLNKSLALYDNGQLDKQCIKAAKAVLNGDTFVTYKKQTIDMKDYLYFSGYIKGHKLQIQNHQFK